MVKTPVHTNPQSGPSIGKRLRNLPRQGEPVFADQIDQTREAIANARELLKSMRKPR